MAAMTEEDMDSILDEITAPQYTDSQSTPADSAAKLEAAQRKATIAQLEKELADELARQGGGAVEPTHDSGAVEPTHDSEDIDSLIQEIEADEGDHTDEVLDFDAVQQQQQAKAEIEEMERELAEIQARKTAAAEAAAAAQQQAEIEEMERELAEVQARKTAAAEAAAAAPQQAEIEEMERELAEIQARKTAAAEAATEETSAVVQDGLDTLILQADQHHGTTEAVQHVAAPPAVFADSRDSPKQSVNSQHSSPTLSPQYDPQPASVESDLDALMQEVAAERAVSPSTAAHSDQIPQLVPRPPSAPIDELGDVESLINEVDTSHDQNEAAQRKAAIEEMERELAVIQTRKAAATAAKRAKKLGKLTRGVAGTAVNTGQLSEAALNFMMADFQNDADFEGQSEEVAGFYAIEQKRPSVEETRLCVKDQMDTQVEEVEEVEEKEQLEELKVARNQARVSRRVAPLEEVVEVVGAGEDGVAAAVRAGEDAVTGAGEDAVAVTQEDTVVVAAVAGEDAKAADGAAEAGELEEKADAGEVDGSTILAVTPLATPRGEVCSMVQSWVENDWFERFIMFAIFLTSIQLAAYDPCDDDDDSTKSKVDKYLDYIFLAIFTVELVLKHIAYGFCEYWAGGWNRLDALVVSTGFITLAPGMDSLVAIRLLRILRPLRIVNKLQGMKQILQTLGAAAMPLADTALLCGLLFFLFGIVAVTLFPGTTRQHCYNVVTSSSGEVSYELDESIEYSYGVAMCGGEHSCLEGQVCSYSRDAPNFSLTAFDNIFVAFLSIFVAVTLEGWVDNMYMLQDSYGYWPATVFFHLLIILASMFAVNLALAVLADSFDFAIEQAEDELDAEAGVPTEVVGDGSNIETDAFGRPLRKRRASVLMSESSSASPNKEETEADREEARAMQEDRDAGLSKLAIVRNARSRRRSVAVSRSVSASVTPRPGDDMLLERADSMSPTSGEWPKGSLNETPAKVTGCAKAQLKFRQVASAPMFADLILLFIILNTVCLALEHKQTKMVNGIEQAADMEQSWQDALTYSNYVFVFVFTMEVLFKLIGFGPKEYFRDSFNCFDFGVVLSSYVELCLAGESAFSALRTFRLMRVFKLTKRWTSMRIILNTVLDTLPQMGYLMLMLCLFMFLASVAGMQLFGCKLRTPTLEEDVRSNFDNFPNAMLTVFQILGGENWNDVMYNSVEATNMSAVLYFVFLVVAGTFIVLNLTLAILLSNFGTGTSPELDCDAIALAIRDFAIWSVRCCKCSSKSPNKASASVAPADKYEDGGDVSEGLEDSDAEPENPWGNVSASDSDIHEEPVHSPQSAIYKKDGNQGRRGSANKLPPLNVRTERIRADLPAMGLPEGKLGSPLGPRPLFDVGLGKADEEETLGRTSSSLGQAKMVATVGHLQDQLCMMHYLEQFKMNQLVATAQEGLELVPLSGSMLSSVQQQVDDEKKAEEKLDQKRDWTGCVVLEPEPLSGVSMWIFSTDNRLRQVLSRFVIHPMFDNFVLTMIVASSITLALEEPGLDPNSNLANFLHISDYVFTAIFTLEMLSKVIVSNFMLDPNAYLKSGFNVLDFSIVCISILSCIGALDSDGLRSLRTFRALKPLRTIKRAPGLRCVVEAILRCMPGFINIALVSSVCYLVFAILGVQFWSGKFWKCSDDSVSGVDECFGIADDGSPRLWQNAPINFDTVSNGMLTLFEVASMELWLDVMYNAMDVPSTIGMQPIKNNAWYSAIYFVIFIIIGSFLIMNLFVGAVVDTFNTVKKENLRSATLSDSQQQFVSSMREMLANKPKPVLVPVEGGCSGFRGLCFQLVTSDLFDNIILSLIGVNILVMGAGWWVLPDLGVAVGSQAMRDAQETPWNKALDLINFIFTFIFSSEAIVKLLGLGTKQYFESSMNIFDFCVVTVSVIGCLLEVFMGDHQSSTLIGVLLIFRAARVMRLFRLTVRFEGVKRLLETLVFTLPSLMNVTMLLMLVLFIFTILGMSFFGNNPNCTVTDHGHYGLYTEHANFRTFWKGFFTLFRMCTGESWNGIMHDVMQQSGGASSLFFVFFMVIAAQLMLNLVIAILLDEFSDRGKTDSYEVTPADLDHFTRVWSDFDPEATLKLQVKKVPELLIALGEPLGVPADTSESGARLAAIKLSIPINRGRCHFIEVFTAGVKKALGVNTIDTEVLAEVLLALHKRFPELEEDNQKAELEEETKAVLEAEKKEDASQEGRKQDEDDALHK